MSTTFKHIRIWSWLVVILSLAPLSAYALITQGYSYSGTPQSGTLASTDPNNSQGVVLASNQNVANLVGVITGPVDASLSATSVKSQVMVASTGTANVIVSTENGPIQKGDYITTSNIAGVGDKAVEDGRVVGIAQSSFTGKEASDQSQTIGSGSSKQTVQIGQIPVALYIGDVTLSSESSYIPVAIQKLADSVTGHQVSALRIIIAGLILLAGLIGVSTLLYGAVSKSITSIGRNPLSSHSILSGLAQVGVIAIGVLVSCGAIMYLVVRV